MVAPVANLNPLRGDPTRTKNLRDRFERELRVRFRILQRSINDLLITKDVFGLGREGTRFKKLTRNVENLEWAFLSDTRKLAEFESWLQTETGLTIVPEGDRFWEQYVQEGYERGAGRAFKDANQKALLAGRQTTSFLAGRQTEFIATMLGAPESIEKVKILASRVFTDLKGVNSILATQIRRSLTDGLVQGDNPRTIARNMSNSLSLGRKRAEVIARTEIIRAHAEGQLDALERMGVVEVGVAVEWSTAGDTRVCPLCAELQGVVLKVKEAHNLIPRHPQCITGDMRICAPGLRAMMSSLYSGEIFDLTLSDGRRVSFTSHHIVLTQRGWVFAKRLTDTDYLINTPRDPFLGIPDKHLGEPRIADLYDAFIQLANPSSVAKSLPMSEYLHGDGEFCDSEINVVNTDSVLRNQLLRKHLKELLLNFGNVSSLNTLFLSSDSSLSKFNHRTSATTDSLMSSFGIFDVLLSRSLTHHELISSSLIPEGDSARSQYLSNGTTTQIESLRESKLGDSRRVEFDNLIGGKLIKVESVTARHVKSLPVYDVTTDSSVYSVNGIVTSNCRCAFVPANVGESTKGQVRTKTKVEGSIEESIKREGGRKRSTWAGKSKKISKARPKSILT